MTSSAPVRLRRHLGFRRFWAASTVSDFGSHVTTLAVQVLVVTTLAGTASDVGLVNAARWLPYLLLGVLVGALADRVRRKPLLVGTDLSRAVLLCAVPLLAVADLLSVPVLVGLMAVFGLLSLLNDAARYSFLPRLVSREALPRANARLEQSSSVAQASGPAVAGGLVSWVGAPAAVLVDAASYLVSGVLTALTPVQDPRPARADRLSLRREMREGLAWVYRHRTLAPLALSTHGWFLFFSVLGTVYVPYALLRLGFGGLALGLTLTAAGVGGLLGSGLSNRLGERLGVCPTVAGARVLEAAGIAVIAMAPEGGVLVAGFGQLLLGIGMGAEGPIEMSYRQAATPDRLQARASATIRSLNRAAVVVGAPLAGVLADGLGFRFALWVGAAGVAVSGLSLAASPFRHARLGDAPPPS